MWAPENGVQFKRDKVNPQDGGRGRSQDSSEPEHQSAHPEQAPRFRDSFQFWQSNQ